MANVLHIQRKGVHDSDRTPLSLEIILIRSFAVITSLEKQSSRTYRFKRSTINRG